MTRDLRGLLAPNAIAVVGASPRAGSVAGEILRNLVRCGFDGSILPVNPKYEEIEGLRCVPSVEDLPDTVDLAILAINRNLVLDSVDTCGRKGIRNLVIITAGFKETGPEGAERERELQRLIQEHDLNVVGPNCMGIINSTPEIRLNASFSRWFPSGGEIAFISQSGSIGETLLECFEDAGLGVSLFVNLGNRAGLSENDFLEHLEAPETCAAIFLYLESFADPQGFRNVVERISRTKPVVVLKAGRTEAGAAAVASHTGSMASPDAVVEAFLRQCGAMRVETIEETLTALRALEQGVLPEGTKTAILTNAGGAGIIAADACERVGIDVPAFNEAVKARLAEFLPPEAGLGNPVDMIATAGAADYEKGLDVSLDAADSAIVVFRPPIVMPDPVEKVAEGLIRVAAARRNKPVLVCTLSKETTPVVTALREAHLPVYAMPETAVEALSTLHLAKRIREESSTTIEAATYDIQAAQQVIEQVRADGRTALFFDEGARILAAYGIPVGRHAYAESSEDVDRFVAEVGFPMVAKVDSPDLFHRFEKGAVLLGLETREELDQAIAKLRGIIDELGLAGGRVLLQETLLGRELIFGLERDASFGPVVMFGIGGTLVEALKDVVFAVAPVSRIQAERTIRSIRAFGLLESFRGQEAVDLASLSSLLSAFAQMGQDLSEIAEVDLNPVVATAQGAAAVDILIRLKDTPTS